MVLPSCASTKSQNAKTIHQTIKFYRWLTEIYSDSTQATYFCFLSKFLSHTTREANALSIFFRKQGVLTWEKVT